MGRGRRREGGNFSARRPCRRRSSPVALGSSCGAGSPEGGREGGKEALADSAGVEAHRLHRGGSSRGAGSLEGGREGGARQPRDRVTDCSLSAVV